MIINIIALKMEQLRFIIGLANGMANSADPDQTAP